MDGILRKPCDHLPALMEPMAQEKLVRGRVAAGIHLQIRANRSLEFWWQDSCSLKEGNADITASEHSAV